jgi:hypothetical protein
MATLGRIADAGTTMSRLSAIITQADIARAIRAAKQAGAAEVEFRIAGATILVRIAPSTTAEKPIAQPREIVL